MKWHLVCTNLAYSSLATNLKYTVFCEPLNIGPAQLTSQLVIIPTLIKTALDDTVRGDQHTNHRRCKLMEKSDMCDMYKNMLSEVDKLLRIYFCFPVTYVTAEHSFSLLRRIKTFLRSSYHNHVSNNLFTLLFILLKRMHWTITQEFVSVNNRRL